MKTVYRKKFLKELAKIPSKYRSRIEIFIFIELPKTDSISESPKLEKLKGHSQYYKVRFGDYRIGIKIEDNVIILERVLHRKDIYRYYP